MISELNERSRDVLRRIIDSYLETGEPVGSRTLARLLQTRLSPATIRTVMADLQEAGLLYAPHHSAGRLPSEAGLRVFVDAILEVGRLAEGERKSIEARCAAAGRSVQSVLSEATKLMAGLSNCAGLVSAPKQDARLKHIEFVNLGPGRALVVLVTADGQVENRIIDLPPGLPVSSLVEASNYLGARLHGRTLDEVRAEVNRELEAHKADLDESAARLVKEGLATWSADQDARALIVSGADKLLEDVHALDDLERVKALFGALETKEHLVALLDATEGAEGVRIFVGATDAAFGLAGCSMIIAPYANSAQKVVGALGVIGPARMNYARIIPVVDYTAKVVSRLLG